ncbi:GNAT family N-acetyltransferase [Microbacterium amylolyticum]|uniref:RimJ/RimL family protein N-acetyltransferase n=1 Tax=Microbacterium amylolyticum TaxID=936337 RepID=A0ABS4ZIS7_9MICO|nr:GNAT family N-acetyltransferase [Microbacterium amylolyticum]MBP2437189.1 RimJ/RimL family protein N-acetyltransferase [Microbacterium amylolyticum]
MAEPVTLRTDRLVLTPPTSADADAVYEACQDPEIQKFTTVPSPYRHDHATGFIALTEKGWADGTSFTWAFRAGGEFAGLVGLDDVRDGSAEIGFWAAPSARGSGYVTEAARAAVDFAFGPMRLSRLEWHAVVGNEASARVAQKLGFQLEGTRRSALSHEFDGRHVRFDGWLAGLLSTDPRTEATWSI